MYSLFLLGGGGGVPLKFTAICSSLQESLGEVTLLKCKLAKSVPRGGGWASPEGHFWVGWRQLVKDQQHVALRVGGTGP